jgi:beta-mannosidase
MQASDKGIAMTRRVLDLSGTGWKLGQAPADADPERAEWHELEQIAEWLPATVPGNIRSDLVRAGRLPDLFFGTQAEDSQWVDAHCWWLVRDWSPIISPGERVHLVVRGIDYVWDVFLNGHHLGRHEGMFSPLVHDVSAVLRAENRLAVRVVGSKWLPSNRSFGWFRFVDHLESMVTSIGHRHPHRRDSLKCQMSFGWDFAPALRTMGIWDDVYAIVSHDVFIRDIEVRQRFADGKARLTIGVEVDAATARPALLRCTLVGEGFEAESIVVERPIELAAGASRTELELQVPQPRLWWPWDQGSPDLYRLNIEVRAGDRCLDSLVQTVGLREVEMDGWTLRINGRRVYARGANWVPADVLPGRVVEEDYRALLSLARQANMNMVRVWGGGLREKRAFYDECDRLGILVWQEFPLACAFLSRFPRSPEYLRLVESESEAIVRGLRAHPSLVLWCGGNEFSPERNKPVVATLRQSASRLDPDRPFLAASPASGDSHNWQVWHGFQPASTYRKDGALFASEFGLQALPDKATLQRFIPSEELWPPGPSWSYHGAELDKLQRYAQPFLGDSDSGLEEMIEASQRAQAHALQIAVEHYRRAKARGGGGVLIWQLNEPWPAISWALVDYYRRQKHAYAVVKRLMNPLLVSLEYPLRRYRAGDELTIGIWVVNDSPANLHGCQVEVTLWAGPEQAVARHTLDMEIRADSAREAGRVHWTLPAGDGWRLTCQLVREGQALASNEYDLTVHDDIGPTVRQRLWSWLSSMMVPS